MVCSRSSSTTKAYSSVRGCGATPGYLHKVYEHGSYFSPATTWRLHQTSPKANRGCRGASAWEATGRPHRRLGFNLEVGAEFRVLEGQLELPLQQWPGDGVTVTRILTRDFSFHRPGIRSHEFLEAFAID